MQEPDLKQVEALLKGITIPPQPKIVLDLMNLFKGQDPDFGKIIGLASSDVALSAKMLKLVNSPLFGASAMVESLDQALLRLGLDNFYNLVLVSSLQATFKTRKEDQALIDALWAHSLKIARACELIAAETPELQGMVTPHLAYMTGLFHDCSMPLMLGKFGDYREAFYTVLDNALSIEMENRQFSTNHALASYLMAKTWRLSMSVCQAIMNHHNAEYGKDGVDEAASKKLWAILILAEWLAPMETEEDDFLRQDIVDDEWIAVYDAIYDELYLTEDRIASLKRLIGDLDNG
jgi:HD-like signal output (HDOD) protein